MKEDTYIRYAPHGVFVADREGHYIYVNPAGCEMTGYSQEELLSMTLFDLAPPDMREAARAHFQRAVEKGISSGEAPLLRKDGSAGWWQVEARALPDGTFMGYTTDVSVRRDAEEALRRMQQALADSEQRLRAASDASLDSFLIFRAERDQNGEICDFIFEYVNSKAEEMLKMKRADLIGRRMCDVLPVNREAGFFKKYRRVVETGEPLEEEFFLEETHVPSAWHYHQVVRLDDGIAIIHRDITERKRMEQNLRESESRVRAKLDAVLSPEGDLGELELSDVIDVKVIQSIMDHFHALTDIGVAILDLSGNVLVANGWQDICTQFHRKHPETAGNCLESDTKLSTGVAPGTFKIYNCKNNMWDMVTPITVGGKHLGNLFLGQFLFEDEAPNIELFRKQARQYGFDEEEYIAACERVPRWSREKVETVMRFYTAFVDMVSKLSYGNLKLARSMTALKETQDRVRHMEKMKAVGQLAGGVAHDFNNQLAGVLGYADLLTARLEDERLNRYARGIKMSALRAADLTKQLLAFGRKGKDLSVTVDIHKLIMEVCELLTRSIDKKVEIVAHLEATPSVLTGDPSQLQNALLNLGLNASDAMPEGGQLKFATRIVTVDGCPDGTEDVSGRCLELTVSDTGTGMTDDVRQRVFEPFFTTKEPGKGTGLGLASVYGTVLSHHGSIEVESEPGHGATFRMLFSLPVDSIADKAGDGRDKAVSVRGHGAILLIEDEKLVREVVADILEDSGYAVTAFGNGHEALDYYGGHVDEIDLVILDMIMPMMGGREVFEQLQELNPDVRVILCSGYTADERIQEFLDAGVYGFIKKPFEKEELADKVAAALAE